MPKNVEPRPGQHLIGLVLSEPTPKGSVSVFSKEPYASTLESYFEAARNGEVPGRAFNLILRKLKQLYPEIHVKSGEALRSYITSNHPEWLDGL